MDVIDPVSLLLYQKVQRILQRSYFDLRRRMVDQQNLLAIRAYHRDCELIFSCSRTLQGNLAVFALLLQNSSRFLDDLRAGCLPVREQNSVDRLEYDAFVMDVLQLAQGISGRMG